MEIIQIIGNIPYISYPFLDSNCEARSYPFLDSDEEDDTAFRFGYFFCVRRAINR